jgi:hypothetical protein
MKKYMRGGLATAGGHVPAQAAQGMAQAAGAGRPGGMPAQAAQGLARAAEMSGRPVGLKKGGKVKAGKGKVDQMKSSPRKQMAMKGSKK